MNRGYIKLYRAIQQNPLWLSETFTDSQAWIDLLMLANFKDNFINVRGIRFPVSRGMVGWSEIKLAVRWRWSRGKVRRFFNFLIHQNMIEIVQQNKYLTTLIKIINYDIYQGNDTVELTENDTAGGTADGQQTDTKNKDKKDKKVKKKKTYTQSDVSNHKEIIEYFTETVKTTKGIPYQFSGGKDGAAIKRFRTLKEAPDYKELIDFFIESDKSDKYISLSACLSADTINQFRLQRERYL